MTISRIRSPKYFWLSIPLTLAGAILALVLSLGADAQKRTYYNYALDPAANVPSLVIQLAGVGKLGF
jgi:pectate lyase